MGENHVTEAACLLEKGASYSRRVGLLPDVSQPDPIFAGFKHGAFSLYFGDAPIYHFDLEGRWQRAFLRGVHYLKGLDATVQVIDRVREGPNLVLKRKTLTESEAAEFDARVRLMALELIAGIDGASLTRIEPKSPKSEPLCSTDLREFLLRISSWDAARWVAHREQFRQTYGPLPFMPPECQRAVVLQVTQGKGGRLEFGFSPAAAAHARSPAEFERHVRSVAALWGRRLMQSRVIFLAGADVIHRPFEDLVSYMGAIRRTFPLPSEAEDKAAGFDGVHLFFDNFEFPRPDRAGWTELSALGLVRTSLGVESGDANVRAMYAKSWANDDLRAAVADIKSAGLGISVLTIVGAGGAARAGSHIEQTARLIDSLALEPGDFVFLLDENELRDPENPGPEGRGPLRGAAWSEQQARLKDALAQLKKRGIKVLPYTMEKQ
jgi:hypothetical protein